MSLPYGAPVPVSPLIRGLRFGLLFAGIFYAFFKQKVYNNLEAAHREEEAIKKVARDKQKAIVKAKIAKEEREAVRQLETGELFKTDEEREAEAEAKAASGDKTCSCKTKPTSPCTCSEPPKSPGKDKPWGKPKKCS